MARENYAYWLIQEIIAKEIQEAFRIRLVGLKSQIVTSR
jgi:hypothetical protein